MDDQMMPLLTGRCAIHTGHVTAWKRHLMAQMAEPCDGGRQWRADQATDEQELY